jgi:hypothetical protein
MSKLPAYTELLMAILAWQARWPGSTERMKNAAETYLTDPALHDGLRAARPYSERLANAALTCAAATPELHGLASRALAEVVPLAIAEQAEARASEQAAQAHAEKTHGLRHLEGAPVEIIAGLPEPRDVRDPVKERIDR